jgi:3-oxoacyl-[acyl-carrier-protein] synthase II
VSAAILAYGAVSALGEGAFAASAGTVGEPARVAIARDEELARAGFAKPFVARARVTVPEGEDRATRLLAMSLAECARGLDARCPGWRGRRVGLAMGTSSGGMRTAERLFARVARGEPFDAPFASRAAYFGPLLDAARDTGLSFAPATLVLCACASSVIAIGLAMRWLELGECDVVLAGGFDAVSPFVASGFESLQATSASVPPRPFRVGRDGMALGEAAAVLALARPGDDPCEPLAYVRGFGASADAVHITAPDRTGAGLARAARAALVDAGEPGVDLLSAHATATPFNDAAEARGIALALGEARAREVAVHAFKAQVGHTLGAAGALESIACLDAMERGILPATAGEGALDPEAATRVLARGEAGQPRVALKLASAFGGANAALVLGREPGVPAGPRAPRDVWLTRAARVSVLPDVAVLAEAIGVPLEKLARVDALVLWGLAAIHALAERLGGRAAFAGAGVVVGTAAATLETNARFASRLRERGPRFVEPRRFPYTSPNAVAGECGVAFDLRGPSFSVGAGLHAGVEALAAACTLVRAGDAERMLVVAVDDIGDVARAFSDAVGGGLVAGGVALLITRDREPASASRVTGVHTSLRPAAADLSPAEPRGHLALAPLDAGAPPARVSASSLLLGTFARATVDLCPS